MIFDDNYEIILLIPMLWVLIRIALAKTYIVVLIRIASARRF